MTVETKKAKQPLNITELRNHLSIAFTDLRNGDLSVKAATEISNMAGKINATLKTQLEYAKLRKEKPVITFLKGDE